MNVREGDKFIEKRLTGGGVHSVLHNEVVFCSKAVFDYEGRLCQTPALISTLELLNNPSLPCSSPFSMSLVPYSYAISPTAYSGLKES